MNLFSRTISGICVLLVGILIFLLFIWLDQSNLEILARGIGTFIIAFLAVGSFFGSLALAIYIWCNGK